MPDAPIAQVSNFLVPAGSLLVLIVVAIGTLFWLWMLVDALTRPALAWASAGRSQLLWVFVLVFTGWIGAVLYRATARPKLRAASGRAIPWT